MPVRQASVVVHGKPVGGETHSEFLLQLLLHSSTSQ